MANGSTTPTALTSLSDIGKQSGCRTRALSLEQNSAPSPCMRQRGLVLDSADASKDAPVSAVMRTEAADNVIARVFTFNHVK